MSAIARSPHIDVLPIILSFVGRPASTAPVSRDWNLATLGAYPLILESWKKNPYFSKQQIGSIPEDAHECRDLARRVQKTLTMRRLKYLVVGLNISELLYTADIELVRCFHALRKLPSRAIAPVVFLDHKRITKHFHYHRKAVRGTLIEKAMAVRGIFLEASEYFASGVHIDISKLNLSFIPPEIWEIRHNVELDISHNQIRKLPPRIDEWKKIHSLNGSHNQIHKISKTFGKLEDLTFLDLSHNNLRELPDSMKDFSKYSDGLDLSGNPLKVKTKIKLWWHNLCL